MGVVDSCVAPQGRLDTCHRQDFSYPTLWNDHPVAGVQLTVSEDRDETTKCLALGENRTEEPFLFTKRVCSHEAPDDRMDTRI